MEDINVILKYRRKEDCWVCPACDTENSMTNGFCSVCGAQYVNYSTTILKRWAPEDDKPAPPVNQSTFTPTYGGSGGIELPLMTPHKSADGGSKHKLVGVFFAIAIVIIILIAIAMSQNIAVTNVDTSCEFQTIETDVVDCHNQPYNDCSSAFCNPLTPISPFV